MDLNLNRDFTDKIIAWYEENKRDLPWRQDKEPYHVWVSEIMLQQTRVEAVRDYYLRFMKELPTIKALAEVQEEKLLKLWEGLGYYNRVRNMQKAAKIIITEEKGIFPQKYEEIIKLPGIGEYTAGAIASNCFDLAVPAVDGNVLRVMTRVMEDGSDIGKQSTKRRIGAYLQKLYPEKNCGAFTQGLMELGATVCVPKGQPKCERCPVSDFCCAGKKGTTLNFPVKQAKKERKIVDMTVFLLKCEQKIALRKRDKTGLLSGLYEFPNIEKKINANDALEQVRLWGMEPISLERERAYTHVFSHVEWDMIGYYITCGNMGGREEGFLWVSEEDLNRNIPLPSAFGYFR